MSHTRLAAKRLRDFPWFVFVALTLASPALAVPEWRHAVHHQAKLIGGIVMGDERGSSAWNRTLPEGWVWCTTYHEPVATYDDHLQCEAFKKQHPDYVQIEQLYPTSENGRTVFEISKWNFLHQALNRPLSEDERSLWVATLPQTTGLRFAGDTELAGAREEFQKLERVGSEKALESAAPTLSVAAFAKEARLIAVRTGTGRVVKAFFEVHGRTFLLSFQTLVADTNPPQAGVARAVLKDLEAGWTQDLDGDGSADLEWSPRQDKKALQGLAGATLAVVRTYPLR